MRHARTLLPALVLFLVAGLAGLVRVLPASGQAAPATLGFAERDALQNGWLKQRFDTILPAREADDR